MSLHTQCLMECCVTHSLSMRDWIDKSAYNDRSTHLLFIWCITGSFTKLKLCNVTHFLWIMGQDCWSQHEALLTNCYHETIYQIYASSVWLTHWYQYHQNLLPRIWWQWLTCVSLRFLLVIWSMTNLVFMWRHWSVTYLLMNICKYVTFHMKVTYLPVHLLQFKFSYANVQFDINAYPEMWKFWKDYGNNIIPCPISRFQNMSDNVNVSNQHFECDPHWSADLTQRSRLFICVETNNWCMLSSSIASAVCWVNSAQFFSGKSMSMKQ